MSVPTVTSTDSELIDWFLNSKKLFTSDSSEKGKDIRHLSLSRDLREFFMSYPIPICEEIKSAFDYWAFLEPVFTPPLRTTMINESGLFADPAFVGEANTSLSPPYHWQWAVEDCLVNISETERAEIAKKIALNDFSSNSSDNSITNSIQATLGFLHSTNKLVQDHLLKIRKCIQTMESLDLAHFKTRTRSLAVLLQFAESLIAKLQRDQFLDSIEEVHQGENTVLCITDDGESVAGFSMTADQYSQTLLERDNTLSPHMEDTLVQYPFDSNSPIPQFGPFCHICRQRKPEFKSCTGKKAANLNTSACHRRFCQECLLLYNWPQSSDNWKCPLCLKLCTCDRCVRAVFIKSLKAFVGGQAPPLGPVVNLGALITDPRSAFAQSVPRSEIPSPNFVTTKRFRRNSRIS